MADDDSGRPWFKFILIAALAYFIGAASSGEETDSSDDRMSELEEENAELESHVQTLQQEVGTLEKELEEARKSDEDTENQEGNQTNSTSDTSDASTSGEGFGDGTHRVGEDIQPGTYRATPTDHCYWERLDGFSGEMDDIKANGNVYYPVIVTILQEDEGFKSDDCGLWTDDLEPRVNPTSDRKDGYFLVGAEMEPGEWRAPTDDSCYWERLDGFTGNLEDVKANGNPRDTVIIEVQESDAGFHAQGCGTWTYVDTN